MNLHIAHLYPRTMNTYGDTGNIICLQRRCAWRGIEITVHGVEIGENIPENIDLYFFGGGQDIAQGALADDLQAKGDRLRADMAAGVPLLAVCGGYQLLGESYQPFGGPAIAGLDIFPIRTVAGKERMIGNVVIMADTSFSFPPEHQTIVGFENHSGKTEIIGEGAHPLGRILAGFGNNGSDHTEGCVTGSAIGCYLHGSLLPKNPHLADWLLLQACQQKERGFKLEELDDTLEWEAHGKTVERFATKH
jgi:CobQ-like glutamine amidotransferase family enzyme